MISKTTGIIFSGLVFAITGGIACAADNTQALSSIAAAETAQKKAASVDGEWRDTGKIIKKAKAAQAEGKFDKAVKLANKAARQGELGYEQANSQRELQTPSYLK
jgi:hypothetical protein